MFSSFLFQGIRHGDVSHSATFRTSLNLYFSFIFFQLLYIFVSIMCLRVIHALCIHLLWSYSLKCYIPVCLVSQEWTHLPAYSLPPRQRCQEHLHTSLLMDSGESLFGVYTRKRIAMPWNMCFLHCTVMPPCFPEYLHQLWFPQWKRVCSFFSHAFQPSAIYKFLIFVRLKCIKSIF